jgi:ATPase subunit of ABC transporter with duplicated ATPase domains
VSSEKTLPIYEQPSHVSKKLLLDADNIGVTIGSNIILEDISFCVHAGEFVGLIGPNGAGKTTLLRLLMGELQPQFGTIKWAEKAKPGYYSQDHSALFKSETSLTEWISGYVRAGGYEGGDVETLIRGTLGRLLFSGDEVRKPVNVISGGEQGRMLFGKLMLLHSNVLIMDEPTNHLDVEGILWLERLLKNRAKAFLVISHDRRFLEAIATRMVELNRCYPEGRFEAKGRYSDFLEQRDAALQAQADYQSSLANRVRREVEWLRVVHLMSRRHFSALP